MRLLRVLITTSLLMSCHAAEPETDVRGTGLREIIEDQIHKNVRESYGELAGQNFSWDDLEQFNRDEVPQRVVDILARSNCFRSAVEKVRAMPKAQRDAYLRRCRLPLRKTWAELGDISPRGTTDAGRKAELEISNAVVDMVEKIIAGTPQVSTGRV